jgi:hypothetical protein
MRRRAQHSLFIRWLVVTERGTGDSLTATAFTSASTMMRTDSMGFIISVLLQQGRLAQFRRMLRGI